MGTGVVGAVIGLAPLLLALVPGSGRIATGDPARPLSLLGVDAALFFAAAVVACMVVFGLLPMAVQYASIRGALVDGTGLTAPGRQPGGGRWRK